MNIHTLAARHAVFADNRALTTFRDDTATYERIVATYAAGGDPADLWSALQDLGFDGHEIQWHIDHPGRRMRLGFVAL